MGDVTGPISTLPGAGHPLPEGVVCDNHPDRPAVARIQGETDSFGSELWDCCEECRDELRAYRNSPEARTGVCDWCLGEATDLRNRRDIDEGMSGRVYRVCGACVKRDNEAILAELADRDNDFWD